MNITSKTILVTGGGSGIGFEIAKLLSQKGNKVIITGRTESKLKEATEKLNNVSYIASDITSEADIDKLVAHINKDFGSLDVLINNAGQAYVYKLNEGKDDGSKLPVCRKAYRKIPAIIERSKGSCNCKCNFHCSIRAGC